METNNEIVRTRFADVADIQVADAIQRQALPDQHQYNYANNIRYAGTVNLVATKTDKIVGFISVLVNQANPIGNHLWERMRPYIAFVGVMPGYQNAGIGKRLVIDASIYALTKTGSNHIFLESNKDAGKFYEKLGFTNLTPEEVVQRFNKSPKSQVYCAHRKVFGFP